MIGLLKRVFLSSVLVGLIGCGGSNIQNPAHVRVFNGFTDRQDARFYFGGELYSAGSVGPAVSYGNELAYGDSPSGSINIVANPYVDPSTNWGSLTAQNLFAGANYTIVGTTVAGTRTLYIFEDGVTQTLGNAYFRFINAASNLTPVYVTLRRASDGTNIFPGSGSGSLAVGTTTGYRGVGLSSGDPTGFIINVYANIGLTISLSGDIPVNLQQGAPVTIVLYNNASGNVLARVGTDVFP